MADWDTFKGYKFWVKEYLWWNSLWNEKIRWGDLFKDNHSLTFLAWTKLAQTQDLFRIINSIGYILTKDSEAIIEIKYQHIRFSCAKV